MTIQNRTVTIKGVFGKNAATTIPDPPVSGASYRDTSVTQQAIEKGWAYKEIVDSAQFNEALYEYAYMTEQIEKYGFLPWCNLTDYPQGALCLGSDGVIYQAVQNTGPSTTAYNPVNDTNHTYWVDFVGNTYVTKATSQTISGSKTFTGIVVLNGLISAGANVTKTINGWTMPNYSAAVSLSSNSTPYTAPSNGYFFVRCFGNTDLKGKINDTIEFSMGGQHNSYYDRTTTFIPMSRGDKVTFETFDGANFPDVYFFPCIGG